jgi:inorganic pyrophosphatase
MHPWHDVYIDEDQLGETFPVVIEVPMGSKNKYELDKESGLLRLRASDDHERPRYRCDAHAR